MNNLDKIRIKQLDKKVLKFKNFEKPKNGWIKTVRETLKMTISDLSKRVGTKAPVIKIFENNERNGTITLNTLNKIAEAVDCKLVYAIVPNDSFKKIIENQTQKIAESMVSRVSHSMDLEMQGSKQKENEKQIKELKKNILNNFSKNIWRL